MYFRDSDLSFLHCQHLCLELLAFIFVAINFPILPLTFNTTVVYSLASAADFVLEGGPFWCLAGITELLRLTVNICLRSRSCISPLLIEPLERSIVLPGVKMLDWVSLNLPVWELLRSKLIDEVVFLLFFEHVKSTVQVLLDQLGCHCRSLFQVSVFYFLGATNDLPERPETSMTK